MPTENPRVTITLDEALLNKITDYKFSCRLKNQTQAIVSLIETGLGKMGYNPAENPKKSPVPAEPETEDDDDLEADLFYQALIADGRVREGEDITDAQLRVFADVLDIIDATFPKLTEIERGGTRETG